MKLLLGRMSIVAALLLIWEALPRLGVVDPELLPPFSAAARAMVSMLADPSIRSDLLISAAEIGAAFALSIPIGLLFGVILGESRSVAQVMDPVIFFLFGIPKSIFLPLFILTMGIGFGQKIVFGVFSTALIVTMNAVAAVRSIKPEHRLVARSYAASRWQTARLVYWPSMLPVLLDGWRTALIFAVTAIMLAEIYAARAGFGHRLADWGENFDLTRLFGGVLLVSLAAIAANESIRWLESRFSVWRQ